MQEIPQSRRQVEPSVGQPRLGGRWTVLACVLLFGMIGTGAEKVVPGPVAVGLGIVAALGFAVAVRQFAVIAGFGLLGLIIVFTMEVEAIGMTRSLALNVGAVAILVLLVRVAKRSGASRRGGGPAGSGPV